MGIAQAPPAPGFAPERALVPYFPVPIEKQYQELTWCFGYTLLAFGGCAGFEASVLLVRRLRPTLLPPVSCVSALNQFTPRARKLVPIKRSDRTAQDRRAAWFTLADA
jgi:hypothetical protein